MNKKSHNGKRFLIYAEGGNIHVIVWHRREVAYTESNKATTLGGFLFRHGFMDRAGLSLDIVDDPAQTGFADWSAPSVLYNEALAVMKSFYESKT